MKMSLVIDYDVQVFPFKSEQKIRWYHRLFYKMFDFSSVESEIELQTDVDPFCLTDKHQLPGSNLNTIVFIRKLLLLLIEIYFPLW